MQGSDQHHILRLFFLFALDGIFHFTRLRLNYVQQKEVTHRAESLAKDTRLKMLRYQINPQVIFLDIQLIGETGFDILDHIHNDTQVVFVTAYDEYAIRAFELNAVDYLLKPVNPNRLEEMVKRLTKQNQGTTNRSRKFEYYDYVYVKLNSHISKFIKVNSILFISAVGNYTRMNVADDKNYVVLKTLKQWEDELPGDNFIRIHRSTIVNIGQILRIEQYSLRYHRLYLKNIDKPFEISRRYMTHLKNNYRV